MKPTGVTTAGAITCSAPSHLRLAQQRPQLVGTNRLALALAFEDAVGQAALVAVQLDDAFFDRARRDQALNRHRP